LIFLKVTKEDFVSGNVPSRQDTLIIIAGQKADLNQWIETLELPHPPGKQVDIVYLNNGDTKIATVKTRPVQKSLFGNGMTRRTINPIFLPFI